MMYEKFRLIIPYKEYDHLHTAAHVVNKQRFDGGFIEPSIRTSIDENQLEAPTDKHLIVTIEYADMQDLFATAIFFGRLLERDLKKRSLSVDFTAILPKLDFVSMPVTIDMNEIVSVDYTNYGSENDRHYNSELLAHGYTRPVAVIKLRNAKQYYSHSKLEFRII